MDDQEKIQQPEPQVQPDKPTEAAADKTSEPKSIKKISIGGSHWRRFSAWYSSHKRWSIPATILVLLIVLATVPWTRYKVAGLVIKKSFTVEVVDSLSHSPVSGATVSAGSLSSMTNGNGKAILHLSTGHHLVSISKKYYRSEQNSVLVPILRQKTVPAIAVQATGRQVKIVVKNLINQKVLSDVDIKVADTTAKTDKNGVALVVLPAGVSTQKTTLSLNGYNNSDVTVKVSDSQVMENDFTLTPAAKVYFLSKRTGKLDIMKINLDGSGAQTVVAGTGNEHDYDTQLMPSPDWKYVALLAKRSATDPTAQLYVLSTADDKLLNVDIGNANFTLKGWTGNSLIYYLIRNDLQTWQTGKNKLKSYNADTGKTTLLDQNAATGDSTASAYEYYAFVAIYNNNVLFAKNWTQVNSGFQNLLADKQNSLTLIGADGQGHKAIANYEATSSVQYAQHAPNAVYIWQQVNSSDKFFDYTFGLAGPKTANISTDQFYQPYPIFYTAPSGKQTFWGDNRDGKHTLIVGDATGDNENTIASLSDYAPYGWFSDNYLLVTKNTSELYIMSGDKGSKIIKITDFQPTGFGGGY